MSDEGPPGPSFRTRQVAVRVQIPVREIVFGLADGQHGHRQYEDSSRHDASHRGPPPGFTRPFEGRRHASAGCADRRRIRFSCRRGARSVLRPGRIPEPETNRVGSASNPAAEADWPVPASGGNTRRTRPDPALDIAPAPTTAGPGSAFDGGTGVGVAQQPDSSVAPALMAARTIATHGCWWRLKAREHWRGRPGRTSRAGAGGAGLHAQGKVQAADETMIHQDTIISPRAASAYALRTAKRTATARQNWDTRWSDHLSH